MSLAWLGRSSPLSHLPIAFFPECVSAGFPSPAEGYEDHALDLNELCIQRPAATYFVRVEGESMRGVAIMPGDILVVDRSIAPRHGDVVVAAVYGEFTVKELQLTPSAALIAHHNDYPPIALDGEGDGEIFGVATSVVRQLRYG